MGGFGWVSFFWSLVLVSFFFDTICDFTEYFLRGGVGLFVFILGDY